MSKEKIALLTELRGIIKKGGKDERLNQLSFRLQSLLEEELDVEPLSLPRFTIIKENSQNLIESPEYPLGAITLDKKGKIRKIGVLESFSYPEIALLREIYLCFIPDELRERVLYQKIIHYILLSELSSYETIAEYNERFLKFLLEQNAEDLDPLDIKQFFSVKAKVRSFFYLIRKNYAFFKSKDAEEIMDLEVLWNFFNQNKLIYAGDEIIETIRVLVKIFNTLKDYASFKEYRNAFIEMKSKGEIKTGLSLRRFKANLTEIRDVYSLSPSFRKNYPKDNSRVIFAFLTFSPTLENYKVRELMKRVPFFFSHRTNKNSFSVRYHGYLILPRIYKNDLISLIERLTQEGYLNRSVLSFEVKLISFLNLNYFRDFHFPKERLINPEFTEYEEKYELHQVFERTPKKGQEIVQLSVLEYLLLDRLLHNAIYGFGFVRRMQALASLQADLLHYVFSKKSLLVNLETLSELFSRNQTKRERFRTFLETHKKRGLFFLLSFLEDLLLILSKIDDSLKEGKKVSLEKVLSSPDHILDSLEASIILNREEIRKTLFTYFQMNVLRNRHQLEQKIKILGRYREYLSYFEKLHIKNIGDILSLIENLSTLNNLIKKERKMLKTCANKNELRVDFIEEKIKDFVKKDLISPSMTSGIFTSVFTNYFPVLLLKYSSETEKKVSQISTYFPRIEGTIAENIRGGKKYIQLTFWIPPLSSHEKFLLCSFIFSVFSESIIFFRRFFFYGGTPATSNIDHYDFSKKKYEYNRDLFPTYFTYLQNSLERVKSAPLLPFSSDSDSDSEVLPQFWKEDITFHEIINHVDKRIKNKRYAFNPQYLKDLEKMEDLESLILKKKEFGETKNSEFFLALVDSIPFIPAFHKFGFSQYYLFVLPDHLEDLDYRLLFLNSFQKVNYPAEIQNPLPLFIRYLFPYRTPNIKYINWLLSSKKELREYMLFTVKKVYHTFHTRHLSPSGWNCDFKDFKTHIDNILFDPHYSSSPEMFQNRKEFDLGIHKTDSLFGPNTEEFCSLTEVYGKEAKNISTLTSFVHQSKFKNVRELLQKGLLFPYFELKNADLFETLYLIVPNFSKNSFKKVLDIFSWFPYSLIYQIEGEMFIRNGYPRKAFEVGAYIKLVVPGDLRFSEFFRLFEMLFSYLESKHFILLHDLVDGKELIKNIFGGLEFMKQYNPAKNLQWNKIDKKWRNHTIYDEIFNEIYPPLIPKEDEDTNKT